jgi:hypothetical protein
VEHGGGHGRPSGHAGRPGRLAIDGDPVAHDRVVRRSPGGRLAAVATIGRADARPRAEVAVTRESQGRAGARVA